MNEEQLLQRIAALREQIKGLSLPQEKEELISYNKLQFELEEAQQQLQLFRWRSRGDKL